MVSLLFFILLTLLVSYFVVSPIVKAKLQPANLAAKDSNHRADDLIARKETIYAAIKDIEFDYQMGKLSEADFQELRQRYKEQAVSLLKEIDKIESKVMKGASSRKAPKNASTDAKFCWMCGTAITQQDKFCANCGTKLDN
jgi:rRNA maturation endonuclease Nob1